MMFRLLLCVTVFSLVRCDQAVDLETRLNDVEGMMARYGSRLDSHDAKISAQNESISALLADTQHAQKNTYAVGFTAWSRLTQEYETGDTLQFAEVLFNVGFDYHAVSSTFYVTYPGLYMFSTTLYTEMDNHMSADIIIINAEQVQTWPADTIQSDQATNLVIAECLPGDFVFVRCVVPGTVEGDKDKRFTTFSGALLTSY